MHKTFTLIIISFWIAANSAFAQISNSGSITAYCDSLITEIPDATPSNLYQTPTSGQRAAWETVVGDLLSGNYVSAHSGALTIDYEVVQYLDTTNTKTYYILRKKAAGANYWGTLFINPDPLRSRLFIQAPHPLHDANTGNQAVVVFKNTSARAFILAGTHRCNSTLLSSCDGTTSVCGGSNQFRKSDQAHNDDGSFQITTALFKSAIPNHVVVQLHGFAKGGGDPDVIMGNGTNKVPAGTDHLLLFRNALAAIDPALTYKIAHIDTAWTELTGTTNTQGRLINGSSDPCGTKPSAANGRFMHIEQAFSKLRDNPASWTKVADALAVTVPTDPVTVVTTTSEPVPQFRLLVNYPNPFNPSTAIQFTVPVTGYAVLTIVNIIGQEVATLFDGTAEAGLFHRTTFDAAHLSSGIYFAKLKSAGKTQIRKMMLMK